jgi:hypothetical protein
MSRNESLDRFLVFHWSDSPKQGFSIVNEDGFSPFFLYFFKIKEYIKRKDKGASGKE